MRAALAQEVNLYSWVSHHVWRSTRAHTDVSNHGSHSSSRFNVTFIRLYLLFNKALAVCRDDCIWRGVSSAYPAPVEITRSDRLICRQSVCHVRLLTCWLLILHLPGEILWDSVQQRRRAGRWQNLKLPAGEVEGGEPEWEREELPHLLSGQTLLRNTHMLSLLPLKNSLFRKLAVYSWLTFYLVNYILMKLSSSSFCFGAPCLRNSCFNCSSICTAVFQMIEGANAQQKEGLGIMTPDYYYYLNQSGTYKVDGTNDSKDFQETMVHIRCRKSQPGGLHPSEGSQDKL